MENTDYHKIFANNLKRIMADKRITSIELSERSGLSYKSLRNWINATRYPSTKNIKILADALSVTPAELINEVITKATEKDIPICTLKSLKLNPSNPERYLGFESIEKKFIELKVMIAIKITDDSMQPRIVSDDICLIQMIGTPRDNDIILYFAEGEYRIKRFTSKNGKYVFTDGLNNIEVFNPDEVKIEGRVIQVRCNY